MRRVYLIRHGLTEGNRLRRYIGRTDEPLCAAGRAALSAAPLKGIETVYVSPLLRARETAAILFPHARQIVVDGLREMDLGAFENRSADDMKNDAAYRAWVDGLCEGDCPGGENRRGFVARTVRAFENICGASRKRTTGRGMWARAAVCAARWTAAGCSTKETDLTHD